jgi:2-(1,2-epoxy-1,2-dihydrophenyl)acetyl-CoA isomerase
MTGAGKAFCAGADIKSPWDPETAALGLRRRLNPVILAMSDLQKPLIAAVNGVVADAGLGFIGAADLRIAERGARFVPRDGEAGIGTGRRNELFRAPPHRVEQGVQMAVRRRARRRGHRGLVRADR